ncbi:anaerobic sulfatase maturase [Syntrophotalea acetylenivorans]|uniref:Anaerobic sulfatase maturase n=1 Tax=Syntrophotalea acetylenivorans TaxID=1842532 RepID=A0A1L3GSU7_9BACT|nr:anaerobic sulfatase maturase [Syntrophotalea acetylenivorans]
MSNSSADDNAACAAQGIHIVAKPIGPLCNLSCAYCFYLEKIALYRANENYRMSDKTLATFVRHYVETQPTPVVEFVWQGGEPTLLGVDFFCRVVELQRPFASLKTITNVLQTNGTLLDDDWCRFLKQHHFMVGLSLDGPREIHDRYRRDRQGEGSFDAVMRGLKLLQKHGVEYNVMASVARETARKPLEVYRFFKDEGVEFIQFVPIIERLPAAAEQELGLNLAGPAVLDREETNTAVTSWTVLPEEYSDFLIAIYEDWVRNDVGQTFVMNFEWALNAWLGNPSPVCIHAKQCGGSVVIEHNGDLFACDHHVYPEYRLGNISSDDLARMVDTSLQSGFGQNKESSLPRWCRDCEVLAACQGGCPKHRFARSPYDESGLHYLCAGYRKFFRHIRKYLRAMTTLLEHGYPASQVMEAIKGPLVIPKRPTDSGGQKKNCQE